MRAFNQLASRCRIAACVFAVAAFVAGFPVLTQHAEEAQAVGGSLPTLSGTKAIEYLKQNRQYDRLMEAFEATRKGQTDETPTNDAFEQTAMLIASDGAGGAQFGLSVAISGETAIVGAYRANGLQGSAYVFVRSGTTWSEQQKLTASDGAGGDVFGRSVAISSETAIIGANGDDDLGDASGSAYVFVRSGTLWSEQQKLTASDGAASDQFGVGVAISGEAAIVGAFADNGFQGSAYTFVRSGTTWSEQQKLTASDGGGRFGENVAISGETAIIGARENNFQVGSAYIFVRSGTTWSEQQRLTASDGAIGDLFGYSVAISGETAIVGAATDNVGANSDQGSAYIFVRSGTAWSEQQKLTAADGAAVDRFGSGVAISGETAIIGASGDDDLGSLSGSAYIFVRSGTTWSQQQKLTASGGAGGDRFGESVAISGETAIVGAYLDDVGANADQGSAYVFTQPAATLGNYPATVVDLSDNITVTPDAVPTGATSITVSTSTSFNAELTANVATGVVRLTNAQPAKLPPGAYTVTVRAFGPGGSTTRTFMLTVTTPPACADITFAAASNFAVGGGPRFVAVGDFNGDGVQDLVIAFTSTSNLSVLIGTGMGSFGAASNFPVASAPASVAVGDFNGDGAQDLATANPNSNNVSVLIGTGTGSFGPPLNFIPGSVPVSVAVGDFNGDGVQDLAAANSSSVSVLMGTGTGSFGAASNFPIGTTPTSVEVGDFNGDGAQDLVTVNFFSNDVSVLLGTGTGSFGLPSNFTVGTGPVRVAVGDFNGDGLQDLATANQNSNNVSVLIGTGTGTFGAASNFPVATSPRSVAVGDFNGDGVQDLAVAANGNSNNVSVLTGTGTGSFGPPSNFTAGTNPRSVAVGDFNGDGVQDLAATNLNSANVSVLLRTCPARLRAPFDFDGDGKTDISIFRPSVGEWWYQRSSDGQVPAGQFGAGTDKITPGDFTGDGKTDIAFWRPSSGEWFVLRSEDSTFFAFPFGTAGDVPMPADYDGDGRTDAAVFRPSSATWFILNSGGSGTGIVNFGTGGDKPVAADYDGDAKADIAIFRPSDGSWWYLRSSDTQVRVFQFGTGSDRPVQGDFTGDGKADIAVWRPSTGFWFVQRSEDNSFFSFPFGTTGDVPVPGDYDGDGRQDAAVFRPSSATWFANRSTAGSLIQNFGLSTDTPVPSAFVP